MIYDIAWCIVMALLFAGLVLMIRLLVTECRRIQGDLTWSLWPRKKPTNRELLERRGNGA